MRLKIFHSISVFFILLGLILFSPLTMAETLSGRVIDYNGNPVPDITVALSEFNNEKTELSITDDDGVFSVSGTNFPVKMNLHPKKNTPYVISKIIIEGIIYYPDKHSNYSDGFVFSIVDGVDIQDVQIYVRKRTLIRGRVLNPDDTPLSNVDVLLNLSGQTINGTSTITRGMLVQLDADGYFEKYVDGPGYFTFSVEYQKKIATTDEIFITGKPEEDNLVLMLGGNTDSNFDKEDINITQRLRTFQMDREKSILRTTLTPEEKSTFTGSIVDTFGNTVSDIQIGLQPMQLLDGYFISERYRIGTTSDTTDDKTRKNITDSTPLVDTDFRLPPRNRLTSQLTSTGTFSFNGIEYGLLKLFVLPDDMTLSKIPSDIRILDHLRTKFEILSVKIGNLIFKKTLDQQSILSHIIFGIKPGTEIDNVEITVKQRISISGKIVYADGTPLKNRNTKLRIKAPQGKSKIRRIGDADGYTSSANIKTDNYGNFSIYVEKSGDYYFHVKYILLNAEAGPITIKDKLQQDDLVLKLNGKLLFPDTTSEDKAAADEEQIPDVWVVNPINGHSYKLIVCDDWHDAHHKATQNGAHLVSINDETENKWIQEIYGSGFFWIGLNDLEKEGEWKWDGGEPVTFKNWETIELFPDGNLTDDEKDHVVMNLNGAWQATAPQSTLWTMTRQAILENDGLLSTIQPKSETQDK